MARSAKSHSFLPLKESWKRHQPARQAAERRVDWNHLARTNRMMCELRTLMCLLAIGEGMAVGRGNIFLFPIKGEFG